MGDERVLLGCGCLYQDMPDMLRLSTGASAKNPQLSTSISISISSSVGGVVECCCWADNWVAASVSRDMHAFLDSVLPTLPHPLRRDGVGLLEREVSSKTSADRSSDETPELVRDDRCMCMVEVFMMLILLVMLMCWCVVLKLGSEDRWLGIVSFKRDSWLLRPIIYRKRIRPSMFWRRVNHPTWIWWIYINS